MVVEHLDLFEQFQLPGVDGGLFRILDAFEVPLHILGRERLAIVESDPFAEAEGMHPIVRDFPFLRQVGDELHFLSVIGDLENAVVNVIVDGSWRRYSWCCADRGCQYSRSCRF